MKKLIYAFILINIFTICWGDVKTPAYLFKESFQVTNLEGIIELSHDNLIQYSEKLWIDRNLCNRDDDYFIDYLHGTIRVNSKNFKKKNFSSIKLTIEYKIIPEIFLKPIYLYKINEVNKNSEYLSKGINNLSFLDDSKLQINGSKTFSVSYSNRKDFDINQSLYLMLSGQISKNIFIEAQLSDSNSPISTSGGSKELSSLDKVYISLYNNNFELSFGDLEFEIKNTDFMDYKTKFDGFKLGVFTNKSRMYDDNFDTQDNLWGAIAVSQGRSSSYKFTCIEGKQGPYYIYISQEKEIIEIVSNSEKLFINGSLAKRGIDYEIDYSDGTITFSELVTSETEIYITFEYTDEKYRNNFYLTSGRYKITDWLNINYNMLYREDDKKNPINDIFTEDDIIALEGSGDNDVLVNGIYEVEAGEGRYILINDGELSYYKYDETGELGKYNIFFSLVNSGEGSYEEYEPDKYRYVGFGNGNYNPVRTLTAPQKLFNHDLLAKIGTNKLNFEIEGLLTGFDKNTFSSQDDSDNQGYMVKGKINQLYESDNLRFSNSFDYKVKSKNTKTFSDLENPKELIHSGVKSNYDSLAAKSQEIKSSYNYQEMLLLDIYLKNQTINSLLDNRYYLGKIGIKEFEFTPKFGYEYVGREVDYKSGLIKKTHYNNNTLSLTKTVFYVENKIDYTSEKTEDNYFDSGKNGSKYKNYKYTLMTKSLNHFQLTSSIALDNKHIYDLDKWYLQSKSQTYNNALIISYINHNSTVKYSHRKLDYQNDIDEDKQFDMVDINSSNVFLDHGIDTNLHYRVNNLEFYPKVRKLIYLGDGAGCCDSLGVYQSDGDYEYQYVNLGEPKLSTEINFNGVVNVHFGRIDKESFLKNISSQIRALIIEESISSNKLKLYVLNPDVLMDRDFSLYSRQNISNSYSYLSNSKKINYVTSIELDKVFDNRYQNQELTRIKRISNELMLRRLAFGTVGIENVVKNEKESRYNSIIDNIETSLRYQRSFMGSLLNNFTLSYDYEKGDNDYNDEIYKLDIYKIKNVLTSNYRNKYMLQLNNDIYYTKSSGKQYYSYLPEKREGFSFKWNISAKYNYSKYVSINLSYTGDKYPKDKVNNYLSLEVKAEF